MPGCSFTAMLAGSPLPIPTPCYGADVYPGQQIRAVANRNHRCYRRSHRLDAGISGGNAPDAICAESEPSPTRPIKFTPTGWASFWKGLKSPVFWHLWIGEARQGCFYFPFSPILSWCRCWSPWVSTVISMKVAVACWLAAQWCF